MLIIGHRGAAGLVAENTAGSFNKAVDLGVDAIEMDVRATKDGRIVVVHDADLKRTHQTPKKVSELTFDELTAIGTIKNLKIPELSEVLSTIKIPVNLEVKDTGYEAEVLQAIKGFPSEIFISSFKPLVLRKISILDRNIKLGLLIAPYPQWNYLFNFIVTLSAFFLKLHSINPHYLLLNPKRMRLLRKFNLKVFTWVVNDLEQFKKAEDLGVDGIVTDYPNLFRG